MSESNEQKSVIDYFRAKWPKLIIYSIPNGQNIPSHQGRKKAKKEGLLAGVSDLFIAVPRGQYHGCYIEMKAKGKTQCSVSPEQKAFIEYAHWQGYQAGWCAGADEAIKFIDGYMGLK